MTCIRQPIVLLALFLPVAFGAGAEQVVTKRFELDRVWAGHPVGFDFLTHGDYQFVAYYNADRSLTVASRKLGEDAWIIQPLDSRVGWDSHNYITMALDRDEQLHISGNMHGAPLVYFRTEKPLDITTLQPIHGMTGEEETRTTYPQWLHDVNGNLLFMYRSGSSGDGKRFINIYDEHTKTWKRLLDAPLLDGTAHGMNAYPQEIQQGPDGWFHLVWMWRDTPDARTNHDISYMKSKDLKNWVTAAGEPLTLPATPKTEGVVVDPVPTMKGLVNMGFGLGFDLEKRPVVHYHKYDESGNSQIYLARWEEGKWAVYRLSSWEYRWEFGGAGSIPSGVGAGPVHVANGKLTVFWYHQKEGRGVWELDPETLSVIGKANPRSKGGVKGFVPIKSDFPGIRGRSLTSRGAGNVPGVSYYLRWGTLSSNRDQPRTPPWPEAVLLEVYEVSDQG